MFKQNTMCPNKGKVTFNVVTVFVWAYDAGALNVRVWVVFQLFVPYTGHEEVVQRYVHGTNKCFVWQ